MAVADLTLPPDLSPRSWLTVSRQGADHLRRSAGISALLHAAALLLLAWPGGRALQPDRVPPIEIEMIRTEASVAGAEPNRPSQPTPDETEKLPEDKQGARAPARLPEPPAVNTRVGREESEPLTVTGRNIKPPEPDSRFRNRPPSYPPDAARIGAEGDVQLLIHVSSAGIVLGIDILRSSGSASLDGAARRAAQLWRFRPATVDGRALPFDYPINFHFALGDHP